MPKNEQPTPAEWKVLRTVLDAGPCSASDVLARVSGSEGWSPSTVKTLLRRLVNKGYLKTRRVGNSFLYSSKRSPLKALRNAGEALLEHSAEGTVGPLLAHLLRQSSLTRGELDELRALIDEKSEEIEP